MANEVQTAKQAAIPAHIAAFMETEGNIADRMTVPSLSYGGKTWAITIDGQKTPLMRRTPEGDEEPVSMFKGIILDYNKRRGRAYYEGAYDANNIKAPDCWSDDGITPDESIASPQSTSCAKCPFAAKNSRVDTRGKGTVACSQHRMLAIIPARRLDFTPLRLKIAITSDYDGASPDQEKLGWFAFSGYINHLRAKGITHTGVIVTKIKFDPAEDYPKLFFSQDEWVSDEALPIIKELSNSPAVEALISGTWTSAGVDEVRKNEAAEEAEPKVDAAAVIAAAKAKAGGKAGGKAKADTDAEAAAKVKADAEAQAEAEAALAEAEAAEAAAAAAAAAAKAKAAAAKAKAGGAVATPKTPAAPAVDDGDADSGEIIIPSKPSAKADAAKPVTAKPAVTKTAAKAEPATSAVPPDVEELMSDWGG